MMRSTPIWCALMLMSAAIAGCGKGPVAADAVTVDPGGWSSSDTVRLSFEVEAPDHRHDLQLGLRHDGDYPFSNLYLFVRLNYPNGRSLTDTLACPLAGPDGRWYRACIFSRSRHGLC